MNTPLTPARRQRRPYILLTLLGLCSCATSPGPTASSGNAAATESMATGHFEYRDATGAVGNELYVLPNGRYFYLGGGDFALFPTSYDNGAWHVRDGFLETTRKSNVTTLARAASRYRIAEGKLVSDDGTELNRLEAISTEKGTELAKEFDETNRQAAVFRDLKSLKLISDEAEVVDGSWHFSKDCEVTLDGVTFTAQKIEANRLGTTLTLSGAVHAEVADVSRDLPETTLFLEAGKLVRINPIPAFASGL